MAAGYHDFVAAEVLSAANLEDFCQNQSVMRFASTSARDTAVSAVKTSGMYALTTDTNRLWQYDGTNWILQAWGTTAGRPGVILTTTALSIPTGALTDVTYATEVSDVDAWHVAASATCTVPTGFDGWYVISFTGKYAAAAGTSQGAEMFINGVTQYFDTSSTLFNAMTITAIRPLAATDTIKVQAFQNAAGAVNIDARLEISWLGR